MLKLLSGFAALSLVTHALLSLLGEGSLRQAASMTAGLLMLLYWACGLQALLAELPLPGAAPPAGVLRITGLTLPELEAALLPEDHP